MIFRGRLLHLYIILYRFPVNILIYYLYRTPSMVS